MIDEDLLTKENINDFRETFKTEYGKRTLSMILYMGGFFNDDTKTDKAVGKRDLCTSILKMFGVTEEHRSNEFANSFMNSIMSLTIEQKQEETDE